MGDPLTDPRAQQLLNADLGEIGSLASSFHRVASQAQNSARSLRGAQGDATWTGQAADAFRTQLGSLPGDLDKVQQSYGEVAGGLDSYEGQLGPIKSQFQSLATQLRSAQSSLTTAQGQLSTAKTNLSTASTAKGAKPTSAPVVDAHNAVSTASGAVGRLQGDVSGLEGHGYRLLDEFDTIRGQARSTVSSAAGIAPSQSWLSSCFHAIGNFMSGVGHVFVNIGKGVVHAAEDLPSDVWHVMEHPTDLHDWAKLGEDTATVAGAVALVAAVVVCPADALGFGALADGAEVVEGAATTVATASDLEKTGADTGLAAEGQGSWKTVGFDAVSDVMDHVNPGEAGAETRVDNLAGKSSGLEQYGVYRATGATHGEAYGALTDEQRRLITKSATKLSDPGRLHYMRSSTLEQLEGAETHLHYVKLRNEAGHFVFDKGKHAVQEAVVPDEEPEGAACGG
jgi:hypothetical protein